MAAGTGGDVDLRAYRFALDLTPTQIAAARQHAGASRWAYNYALSRKIAAQDKWRAGVKALEEAGMSTEDAKAMAPKVAIPTKPAIQKAWIEVRAEEDVSPWYQAVSSWCFLSAFGDADKAWGNWRDSQSGKRAGPPVGFPRFKKKHRTRDSFRLHQSGGSTASIRPDSGYRRVIVPKLGSLRLHSSAKRLCRALRRGAVIQSVTISRGGHRWYASILVKTPNPEKATLTRRQREAGTIGVDLGVKELAALSNGELIPNPRHFAESAAKLKKAQQALSRTQRGSNRRSRAARKVARINHEIAERRSTTLHGLTKRLATRWETIAVEDLNVAGMTRSAKGTVENPGRNVKAKSGLNRALLDASPGELRRQLAYKTNWYGSTLAVIDRWYPSSQTCSTCGARAKLTLADRVFRCAVCGLILDRDVNAAINIAAQAAVAPGKEETKNARGAGSVIPPSSSDVRGKIPVSIEAGRPPPEMGLVTSPR